MMHSIFTEQPSVRRVFLDNVCHPNPNPNPNPNPHPDLSPTPAPNTMQVPHKMSEKEFWQRCLHLS